MLEGPDKYHHHNHHHLHMKQSRVPALNVDFQEPRIHECVNGDALFRDRTKVGCWVGVL
jgi:hypothetical protein